MLMKMTVTRHFRTGDYTTEETFDSVTGSVVASVAFAFASAEGERCNKVTIEVEKAEVPSHA